MVAYQTVVLQSRVRIRRPPSPQLTANLLVGCHLEMALGCGLTSVRGNRGENYENEPLVRQKTYKEKKKRFLNSISAVILVSGMAAAVGKVTL
jgi:hypothetical protein